jgi:transposase
LYGAIEVQSGEHFFREGERMNREGFEAFLQAFSECHPQDFHVLQVDNAKFHTSEELALPENVMLLYQPPYSPEVNPTEQVWEWLKGQMAGELFETVSDLQQRARELMEKAGKALFQSIVHRKFILEALRQAGI